MSELELCSPIFEVKAGQLLDWTIPIINIGIKVPLINIVLFNPFCVVADKVFDILMSLGDKWAEEFYEAEEEEEPRRPGRRR